MTARKDQEPQIEDIKLTFGNIGKIVVAVSVIISIAGSYYHLLSRQEQFEKSQELIHKTISEQLVEIRQDAKDSKILINDMRLTLQRTNVILEQTIKQNDAKYHSDNPFNPLDQ